MTLDDVARDLEMRFPSLLDGQDLPGIAVGLCDAQGMGWSVGYGVTRAGGSAPITTRTMFSVQSCSKMYTATAVMLAVQRGLVALDTPIVRYLPEFRVHSSFEAHPEQRITLRHLLSHTAGFTHEAPVGSNYRVGCASFDAHCASISDTWLRFPVGHHHEYSNLGIDLAGYIVQRTSELPFPEFVRRELLAPLGMDRTTFDQHRIAVEIDRAVGHNEGSQRVPVRIPMVPAGGLYTSVDDACRYIGFHLNGGGKLLDPALLAEIYRVPGSPDRKQGYGLGIALLSVDGTLLRGHIGGGFGFLADMYWSPAHQMGMVVLTNSVNHALQWTLVREVFGTLEPRRRDAAAPNPLPAGVPVSRDQLDASAGTYVGRIGRAEVVVRETGPVLIRDDEQSIRFTGPREFIVEGAPRERFRFRGLDDDGRPGLSGVAAGRADAVPQ